MKKLILAVLLISNSVNAGSACWGGTGLFPMCIDVPDQKIEYKVIRHKGNIEEASAELTLYAMSGWRVVGVNEYRIILERTVK